MKNVLLIFIFVLFAMSTATAQFFKQSDVDIYKKDVAEQAENLVKENLDLTEEQAKIFWPLYKEYNSKTDEIKYTSKQPFYSLQLPERGG